MHRLETVTGDHRARVTALYTIEAYGFPVLHAVMLGTTDIFDALTVEQTHAITDECLAAHDKTAAATSAESAVDAYAEGQA